MFQAIAYSSFLLRNYLLSQSNAKAAAKQVASMRATATRCATEGSISVICVFSKYKQNYISLILH